MKFGKYLAARQLELPEYSSYFINYKQLKKLINKLINDNDIETGNDSDNNNNNNNSKLSLQDKKGSFFFKLERELEKVNAFYLEMESELRFRLDLLIERKIKSIKKNLIFKNSIVFISLFDGFKKFSKDLDRLEQFVRLNETGFTKVLKKWDKKSKSKTRELYITTAINVQPIFHRNQIVELSDLVANNLLELEALSNGDDNFIRYNDSKNLNDDDDFVNSVDNTNLIKSHSENNNNNDNGDDDFNSYDQLYTDFYDITLQNANLPTNEQLIKLKDWSNQIISKLNTKTKKLTFSKVFQLLIKNLQIPDESILQFYQFFKEFIDLNFVDDLNGRNCIIEASICKTGRNDIFKTCLYSTIDPSIKDFIGRSPLHYLSENGRDDLLILILDYIKENFNDKLISIIDSHDNESISPLLLAIINNHQSTVKILLDYNSNGFPKQNDAKPMYLPLNIACKFGNLNIVQLLLQKFGTAELAKQSNLLTNSSQCNAEGLLPLHIVASSRNIQLVPLLLEYGADINQLDKLNKWPAIFYSVFTNDKEMTKCLLSYGADLNIFDEDNYNALFYAMWEGNISVLNALLDSLRYNKKLFNKNSNNIDISNSNKILKPSKNIKFLSTSLPTHSLDSIIDLNNIDMIPELSLPPPIIPLRKYGHNFLEKRIFLKLSFFTNRYSVHLLPDIFLTSMPGRITVSNNELIPRNLLLPVLDNEKNIIFQLDSIDDELFEIDFELFPTFGTRLLAKATLTSSILKSQYPGLGIKNTGYLELPLLDIRLKTIGSLKFTYELIYPYSGKPLEISMYDTYWKLSSSSDEDKKKESSLTSFVTSSSLNGSYYTVNVVSLHDGTPIICPNLQIDIGNNVKLPITLFNYQQLKSIIYKNNQDELLNVKNTLQNLNFENLNKYFNELMSKVYLPLNEFLELVPSEISLNLEIFYPTTYELENYEMKEFAFLSNNKIDESNDTDNNNNNNNNNNRSTVNNNLNNFIDSILTDIFTHVRKLRNNNNSLHSSRQIVLSSNNSYVCTILNWKQPNYPVFYNLNGIKFDKNSKNFIECTANGILKDDISTITISNDKENKYNDIKNKILIDNIDSINKDSTEFTNLLDYDDKLTRSIKLAVNFACSNNLLGITIPERILNLSNEIVKSIKSKGLILVASRDDDINDSLLSFNNHKDYESIEIDNDNEDNSNENDVDDDGLKHLEIDSDIKANGIRNNNVLQFIDSIEV